MKRRNIIERIERYALEMRDGECWLSSKKPHKTGYTCIGSGGNNCSTLLMHRVAWEAHNAEPIPEGMVLMHTCDNPACFNPEHLVLGTQKDNIVRRYGKGTYGPWPWSWSHNN